MKLNIRDLLFAFGAGYLYGRSVKRRELPRTRVNYNNLHLSKTGEDLCKENKIIKSNYSQPVGDLYKINFESKYCQPEEDLYIGNKIIKSNYS